MKKVTITCYTDPERGTASIALDGEVLIAEDHFCQLYYLEELARALGAEVDWVNDNRAIDELELE